MSVKTILFIGNHYKSSKSNQNVWFELPERLSQLGWERIITSTRAPRLQRLLDMLWVVYSKRDVYQIAQLDVFSGPSFIWVEIVVSLLKALGKPYVLTLRGGNLPGFARKYPNRVRHVLSSADQVVAPSHYLQECLALFRNDIQVIPNPIEVNLYSHKLRCTPACRLIWVRAFHEIYNPLLAVRVLAQLIMIFHGIKLIMVGPDKGDGSLQRFIFEAKKLGVYDRIELPGGVARNTIPDWLSKGDIFINTTNFDNTPSSVVEAMACGLPIVSTNVGGIPWLIKAGEDGLLVPPNDVHAMGEAIQRLIINPGLAGRLSANARKKAENFDWAIVLPQWNELFLQILLKGVPKKDC